MSSNKSDDLYFKSAYPLFETGFHYLNDKGRLICDFYQLAYYIHDKYKLVYNERYSLVYKDTHFVSVNDTEIKSLIIKATKEKIAPSQLDNAFKLVKYLDAKYLTPSKNGLINVANGVLSLEEDKLYPHDYTYNFNYVMPVNYDKNAKCEKWFSFLDEVLLGDPSLILLIQEMFGYVLLGGDPFLHKAFVLLGEGRNGKSTVLSVLKQLISKANYAAVPINLLNKPFSAIQLRYKLANIVGEVSTSVIDSEAFKTAIGGEQLNMSHKRKDEFGEEIKSRFIFASNRLPNFGDTTTGTYEKLTIIPFNYYIPPNKRDTKILSKLYKELPGILNWSIEGASRLLKNGRLSDSQSAENELEKWRCSMDPVFRFIISEIEFVEGTTQGAKFDTIYNRYKTFCEEEGIKPYTRQSFIQKLHQNAKKEYDWRGTSKRVGRKKETYLTGMMLKSRIH